MRKLITLTTIFIAASFTLQAQHTFPGKNNQHTVYGGENGNNVAAIFATENNSRQAAIRQTVEFLSKYDLIKDKAAAEKAVMEYDDTQSEFTVPVSFRFGWHGTAPVMGAVSPQPPVILNADLLFQFYDEGKVRLIVKNFEDMAFFTPCAKSKVGKVKVEDILTEKDVETYKYYMTAPVMRDGMGKFIAAFLVWGNLGLDKMGEFYSAWDEYLKDIDTQIDIAGKLAKGGYFMFGTAEDVLAVNRALAEKDDLSIPVATLDNFEKDLAAEKLCFVFDLFWKRDIKVQFDYLFIAVNSFFGGKIEAIAENGEITWELEGDRLLPKDSKLRKKMGKTGDYFSYYGE